MLLDKDEIDQIKKEHIIMRSAIERIWTMHESCIREHQPLQEKVLWFNIKRAILGSKPRTASSMGIPPVKGEITNSVKFKVIQTDGDSCENKDG